MLNVSLTMGQILFALKKTAQCGVLRLGKTAVNLVFLITHVRQFQGTCRNFAKRERNYPVSEAPTFEPRWLAGRSRSSPARGPLLCAALLFSLVLLHFRIINFPAALFVNITRCFV